MAKTNVVPYEQWLEFYKAYFPTLEDAVEFVRRCEDCRPLRHPSRLIMHQCQRLVSLARDVRSLRPAEHSLQVLLLLICAETVAKLHDATRIEGESRKYVHRFFEKLLPEQHGQVLRNHMHQPDEQLLSLTTIVDALYDVRCQAAHEGQYWSVFFSPDGTVTTYSRGWEIATTLTLDLFEEIAVRGCIASALDRLDTRLEVPDGGSGPRPSPSDKA